jgi:cystathionine beta-lyase/cystathionine gamma-synthase
MAAPAGPVPRDASPGASVPAAPPAGVSLWTRAVHGAGETDPWCGAIATPLVQSTTYVQQAVGRTLGHAYSRVSNPTVDALERQLGALEDAPPAVTFSTGLAAETALFLSLLRAGDHAVVGGAVYGGTVRLFRQVLSELGVRADFVDATDAGNVARALTGGTRLIFIETPANPTLALTDISAAVAIARSAGVPLVVDNTFLTPVIQRPLDLGADACVYSTTKHIEGHSTALGGSVTSRDEKLLERLRFLRKCTGSIQTPFQAWLTSRGLKTLPLRLRQHSANALTVARWLRQHPAVAKVHYPGLAGFPQRELAQRQHRGPLGELHGGLLSFELAPPRDPERAMNALELCSLVEHLGGVETLVTHPASMTHADVPREHRLDAGITDGLVRISVGLEEPADIIADLDRAFDAARVG